MAMPAVAATIREPGRSGLGERALYRLWRNAAGLPDGLKTEDGHRYRVVYPGRLSSEAGPDFRDSVIATDTGDLLKGDVELHVDAPDWERHGHHTDPNYNGVILHVVLRPKGKVDATHLSQTRAPVASLEPLADDLATLAALESGAALALDSLDNDRLERLLDGAGDQRFFARSSGFASEMETTDPEEVAYRALMEGLGYASNRKPFRELAGLVPMAVVLGLRGEPGATRLLAVSALLARASGLLDRVEPALERSHMKAVLARLPRARMMAPDRWRMFRVRPANHPVRRLAGAARLVDRYIESGLVRGLGEEASLGRTALVRGLTVRPFVGPGRAKDLAVNVALPFLYAWSGIARDRSIAARCLELYREFPSLPGNEVTREMTRLLSAEDRGLKVGGARRQQGLMHLYKMATGPTASNVAPAFGQVKANVLGLDEETARR